MPQATSSSVRASGLCAEGDLLDARALRRVVLVGVDDVVEVGADRVHAPSLTLGGGQPQGSRVRGPARPPAGGCLPPRPRARPDRPRSARDSAAPFSFTAAGVAAYGLADVYLVPLSWWRHNGTVGWFRDQLGLGYSNLLSGLPQNFVYNAGGNEVFRRLTSTFLSPLATGYLLVVALFHVPLRKRYGPPVALLLFAALLWTHTRAALLALVLGLLVIAVLRRRARPLVLAILVAAIGFAFVKEYTRFGPRTHFTPTRADRPGAERQDLSARVERCDERERRVDERAPREPARRHSHRHPPPVGLRPRQRGGHRVADARAGQGRRVDLHRARCRDRACSAACCSSPGHSRCCAGSLAAVARGDLRRRARDRAADRRDRDSLAGRRRLGAGGRRGESEVSASRSRVPCRSALPGREPPRARSARARGASRRA